MKIRVDPTSKTPASEQVRSQLAVSIDRGRLLPGDRLPAVRELAAELGLAPNTVAKAYRGLEAEGLLQGRGRRGTFVWAPFRKEPHGPRGRLGEAARAYAERAGELGFDAKTALAAVRRALRSQG